MSSGERLALALQLFDQALEQPIATRAAWLADACGDDDALRREVEAMLAADATGIGDPLTPRLAAIRSDTPDADTRDDLPADTRIGPWHIRGVLGRGGMGAVYRVARSDGDYEHDAALKRIRIGLDNPHARERFLRERRILARLRHPGIAGLIDGGVDDAGAPYFVMTLVDGERIDRWCDAHGLDVRARVRLLLQVLDAVAFAHRQLVVHRDLKPSNIVVDADGHVFLLDFGIAKLMKEGGGDTRTLERAFTPEYASPEQLHGEPVSTATDLYQLGVLMYALLTQAHPYGLTGDTPLRTRLARMDGDPQPLWDAALHASAEDAAQRASTPAALAKQLRGDLSAIARHCLSSDPALRYGSVDALRADLLAWLDGKPVSARAPTRRYRASRFIRRNKLAVGAAAAAVAALCAGLGIALWQAHEARLQAQRADVVNAYLVDLFRSIDPDEGFGPETTVRQLIDLGATRLDRGEMANQPAAVGKLRLTLADGYIGLGEYAKASTEVARAIARLDAAGQYDDAMQARIRQCEVLQLDEELDATGNCLDAAEGWRKAHAGALSEPEVAAAHLQKQRAQLLGYREQYAQAETLAHDAWQHMRRLRGEDDPMTRGARLQYAGILSGGPGKHKEAAIHMQAIADSIRRDNPLNALELATTLHNLAVYRSNADDAQAAIASEREALQIRRRLLPPTHPYIAISSGELANLLADVGSNRDALPLHAQAVAIYLQRLPGQEEHLARELNNWGVACYRVGDMACATAKIDEAVALWASTLPADDSRLLAARGNLAALYSRSGKLAEGEAQLRAVVAAAQARQLASPSAQAASSLAAARNELSTNLLAQRRPAEALAVSRQCWQDLQAGGDPNSDANAALAALALAELANGLHAPALQHARMAQQRAHANKPGGIGEAFATLTVARALLANRDVPAAIEQARSAITLFTAAVGDDHRDAALARGVLGRALLTTGQRDAARKELDAAIATLSVKAPWLPELAELRALR